jgi:hypothetical protein
MTRLIGIILLLWLIAGFAGAWMLEGTNMRLQTVAAGPFSLVKGFHEASPSHPERAHH